MNANISVQQILETLKTDPFVQACKMKLGYTAGLPILQVRNDQLCMMVPFLRYKVTGKVDQTLVYPIRYTVTILLPECLPVAFEDLSFNPGFQQVDFSKPVGLFRHEAVRDLNREAYKKLREELISEYDRVVRTLLWDEPYAPASEVRMSELLQRLLEPSLWSMYRALDGDFFQKYFL